MARLYCRHQEFIRSEGRAQARFGRVSGKVGGDASIRQGWLHFLGGCKAGPQQGTSSAQGSPAEALPGTGESGLEANDIKSARVSVGKPWAGLLIPACHARWSRAAVIPSKDMAAGNGQRP